MRILYSYPLRLGVQGIGATAWYQVDGLIKRGHEVDVMCASCERRLAGEVGVLETLKPFGIRLPLKVIGRANATRIHDMRVASAIQNGKTEYDILHAWPSGALLSLRAAKSRSIPSVVERQSANTRYVYERAAQECSTLGMSIPRGHYSRMSRRKLSRQEQEFHLASALLCPSDFVIQTFTDAGFAKDRLVRHRYGFDPQIFRVRSLEMTHRSPERFSLLYVGQLSPLKGVHYALEAWLRSEPAQTGRGTFTLLGSIVKGYQEVIGDMLSVPTVDWRGPVENVPDFMAEADALIIPSLAEGSALVSYEARASACVLLVSTNSGAECDDEIDALVHVPGDIEKIVDDIDRLATDHRLLSNLSGNSLRHAENATWSAAAESLELAYSETIRRSS